ncbi:MAG: DinB family protein [Anaerolineae bacterium]|nr:DinB family protein [Anaerolineae bacterium]
MNLEYCLAQLTSNAAAIEQMVAGLDSESAHWKPSVEDWSVVEVMCHLADEEREDFRSRFQFLMSGASGDPPPNDSEKNVTERRCNERDLASSLADYLNERKQSLDYLRRLTNIPFDKKTIWSWGRTISVGDMLVSWVAHDVLHLRQLTELKWGYQMQQFAPYDPGYAGDW